MLESRGHRFTIVSKIKRNKSLKKGELLTFVKIFENKTMSKSYQNKCKINEIFQTQFYWSGGTILGYSLKISDFINFSTDVIIVQNNAKTLRNISGKILT